MNFVGKLQRIGKIQATRKEDGTLVTLADKWSDAEIRKAIANLNAK